MTKTIQQEKDPEGSRQGGTYGASRKFNTQLFYGLIGIASSLGFFLLLYWSLSLNSSITSLIQNTNGNPLYLWPYAILTSEPVK